MIKMFYPVQVDVFSMNGCLHHVQPFNSSGFLILWDWVDNEADNVSSTKSSAESNTLSSGNDVEEDEPILDTVTFKCIGVTRDSSYQDVLKSASSLLREGKTVPVRVESEPFNPFDAKAICFQCLLDSKWTVFAYVIKELCDSVHESLLNKSIISTEFAWVKYKVVRTSGPGYYAAVNIKRRGKWPTIVHRYASTIVLTMYHTSMM